MFMYSSPPPQYIDIAIFQTDLYNIYMFLRKSFPPFKLAKALLVIAILKIFFGGVGGFGMSFKIQYRDY